MSAACTTRRGTPSTTSPSTANTRASRPMAATPTDRGPREDDYEPGDYEPDDSEAHYEAHDEPSAPVPSEVLADPGQRLLARIVDTLIVGLPVIMVIRAVVHGHHAEVIATPIVAGALFVYEWPQLAIWGQTLGKRFAGVQVVREGAATLPATEESAGGPGDRSERSEGRAEG